MTRKMPKSMAERMNYRKPRQPQATLAALRRNAANRYAHRCWIRDSLIRQHGRTIEDSWPCSRHPCGQMTPCGARQRFRSPARSRSPTRFPPRVQANSSALGDDAVCDYDGNDKVIDNFDFLYKAIFIDNIDDDFANPKAAQAAPCCLPNRSPRQRDASRCSIRILFLIRQIEKEAK